MNTKTTLILAILAVAVAACLFFVVKPWETPVGGPVEEVKTTAKPLFDPKPTDVDRVEVLVRGEQSARVFKKETEGWMIHAPTTAPATEWEITSNIVDKVGNLKYLKEYPVGDKDRPDDNATRFNNPVATVKLMKGDKVLAELVVGSSLPTGKGNFVKRGGSDVIYESQDSLADTFDKKVSTYRNKRILNVKLDDVKEIAATGLSAYKLVKSGSDWLIEQPERGRADKMTVESNIANPLIGLYVSDFVDDAPGSYRVYGLDEPRLALTLKSSKTVPPKAKPGDPNTKPADTQPSTEEVESVLLVGGSTGENNYYARLKSAPWVFTLSSSTVDNFSKKVSDLRDKALAKVESAKVIKVVSKTPDGEMTLAKLQGKWSFADGTVCDATAVDDLIKALADLKATDFVDASKLLMPLDWSKPRASVTVTQEGQVNPVTVLVGAASSSGKMVYVKNAAEDAVAAVHEDQVTQLLAGPLAYGDRQVLQFPRERATKLEITRAGAETVTLKQEKNVWSMASPVQTSVDADAARNLMQDLSTLRAKSIVGKDKKAFGLDSPAVTLAVYVEPLTADPKVKVASTAPAATKPAATKPATTQPGKKPTLQDLLDYTLALPKEKQNPLAIQMLEEMIAKEKAAATQPASQPATKPAKYAPGMSPEELLEFQKTLPEDQQNPKATEMLEKLIVERKASESQPAGEKSAATEPPPPPTVYRLMLSQKAGKTYACRADRDLVYELESKIYDDATAEMHERQVAKLDSATVTDLTLVVGGAELSFRKSGDEWTYVADPVLPIDKTKVDEVLNAIRDLKTHRYVAYQAADMAKYGLGGQVDRVSVVADAGKRIEILLSAGGPAGDSDKSRYAALSGSKAVFLLKGEQVDKFSKKLDDFEKKADSPATGGNTGSPMGRPMGGGFSPQ
ncbi:MAG: DUF4340 domain-containing protein [Planctomycetes bacterium]|nr:DUF4340 domain-containing protein [Planctomycetota bacterium]